MKKAFKKGETVNVDGVTILVEKADENGAVGTTANTTDPIWYHLKQLNGIVAGGRTERRATIALKRKIFESTPEQERIADFISANPPDASRTVEEWMDIFQKLTGACSIGIYNFIREHGYKKIDRYTTVDFLREVDGTYSTDLINKLKRHYTKEDE